MYKTISVLLFMTLLLAACANAQPTPEPTGTATAVIAEVVAANTAVSPTNTPSPSPTATQTPLPTQTPQPTAAPTETATNTPIPTPTSSIRVLAGTAVPQPGQPVSPENVTQLTELARWGRGVINDIDLSGNGRWVAVGTATGVYIHDTQDLSKTVFHLETPTAVESVAISPDGRLLVVNPVGEFIQVWDVQANQLMYEKKLSPIITGYANISFSPNGDYIILSHRDGVHILSAPDGEIIQIYPDPVWARFSPDGSEVAVWSYSPLSVYSWPGNELVNEINPLKLQAEGDYTYDSVIGNMQFLPNGEMLISILPTSPEGITGGIIVQHGNNGTIQFEIEPINQISERISRMCNEPVYYADPPPNPQPWQMELSSDGEIVAFIFRSGRYPYDEYTHTDIRFYDQSTGQNLYNFEEGIEDIAMSPNSDTWVAGLQNGRLQVRSLTDGAVLDSVDDYDAPALKTVISPDNELVAVEYLDEVKIFRMATGAELYQYPARHIVFAPDNETFALGYEDGRLEIRNLADGHLRKTIFAHDDSVTAVTYLPTGELISTGLDCGFYAWDTKNGALIQTFENYLVEGITEELNPARISNLSASQNSPFLVGKFSNSVGIWNVESGALLNVPELQNNAKNAAIYEQILAIAGNPLFVGNLDATGQLSTSWEGDLGISVVAFSPDGKSLASGTDFGRLQIFLAQNGELLHELIPMTDRVTGLDFAGNGRYLVSTTIDGIVHIWGIP